MNSKKLKHWIAISITGTIIATMSPLPASAEWTRDSQNNWNFYENGNVTTGWKQVDGTWYYFDDNGNMKTGWVLVSDSKWYYLNSDGSMKTEWLQDSDRKWYNLGTDGAMKTGWVQYNNEWYNMDSSGAMRTGWIQEADGKMYFASISGVMQTGVIEVAGNEYAFEKNGEMLIGNNVICEGNTYKTDAVGVIIWDKSSSGGSSEVNKFTKEGVPIIPTVTSNSGTGTIVAKDTTATTTDSSSSSSSSSSRVSISASTINVIGTAKVGVELTASSLTLGAATVSYQWKICDTQNGTYTNINEATTNQYTPVAGDVGKFIKVVATGTGSYSDTATSAATTAVEAAAVVKTPITAIAEITGTPQVGVELTAGALSPAEATASYQWQICDTADGTYTDISGEITNQYTPVAGDVGKFIKVVATGTGSYSDTATSSATTAVEAAPVVKTPITAIAAITGTPQVGATLTAGALSPAEATASYQWQICDTADGTYTDISGEITNQYTPVAGDVGKFIKVVATGTGSYSDTATSSATTAVEAAPVVKTPITAITAITGTPQVGATLTAGGLDPAEATASYQWQICDTADGTYTDISGEITNKYTPVASDVGKFIKVVATGTGSYSDTATSSATTAVEAAPVVKTPITAIAAITGTPQVGATLTAGALSPAEATASYQWQICDTADGTYTDISGEITNQYTPVAGDVGKFIKVVATGTGSYSDTATSSATTAVEAAPVVKTPITAITAITGTPQVGATLTAGGLDPAEATASYQWQICDTADGTYTDISGEITNKYTPVASDVGKFIKVVATGTGSYSGTVTSEATTAVKIPITAIAAITGTLRVTKTLTAGELTPSEATVSYQWQRSGLTDGTYTNISGAIGKTYTLTSYERNKYIRVVATGTGDYSGIVTSATTVQTISSLQ